MGRGARIITVSSSIGTRRGWERGANGNGRLEGLDSASGEDNSFGFAERDRPIAALEEVRQVGSGVLEEARLVAVYVDGIHTLLHLLLNS